MTHTRRQVIVQGAALALPATTSMPLAALAGAESPGLVGLEPDGWRIDVCDLKFWWYHLSPEDWDEFMQILAEEGKLPAGWRAEIDPWEQFPVSHPAAEPEGAQVDDEDDLMVWFQRLLDEDYPVCPEMTGSA